MNILISPNSMKGSLDSRSFAEAVATGFRQVSPVFNLRLVPVADGGDHTGEVLGEVLGAREYHEPVADPLGRRVTACYRIAGDTAVVELAASSGLRLLKEEEYNPGKATTYGTGELIRAALERGCRRVILGLGGSATIDGGIGMLGALGFSFFDKEGNSLPADPSSLARVERIGFPDDFWSETEFILLADVSNPLLGDEGAVTVFGNQKGAGGDLAAQLEEGLLHWISLLERISGKSLRSIPGMGAAGGTASGVVALLGGTLREGAGFIFDLLGMERHIEWADWVITGEGRCDTRGGKSKAPGYLVESASLAGKPVTAITGSFEEAATDGYAGVFSISNGAESMEELIIAAADKITGLAGQIARMMVGGITAAKKEHLLISEAGKAILENNLEVAESLLNQNQPAHLSAFWYLKGSLHQKLQKWGEAVNCFRKSLELDPGNRNAATGVTMVNQILSFRNPDLMNP